MALPRCISWQLFACLALSAARAREVDVYNCTGVPPDGVTNQGPHLQRCVDGCLSDAACSGLYFTAGRYLLNETVIFNHDLRPAGATPLTLHGQGRSVVLVWAFDGNLLLFTGAPGPTEAAWDRLTVENLVVEAAGAPQSGEYCALNFTSGLTQSLLANIVISAALGPGGTRPGGGFDLGPLTDTVTVDNCLMYVIGIGIRIGRGSEVRVKGGRICGDAGSRSLAGVGIHVTGNNGGVHVIGTDVIGHMIGVLLDNSSGAGSNREVFLAQATLDSNFQVRGDRPFKVIGTCLLVGVWSLQAAREGA